jgi:hypothetical protein
MPIDDIFSEKEPQPNPAQGLSRELRKRLASEIESLPEFNTEDWPGRPRPVSHRDAERIVGMIQNTLKQVTNRGGFINDVPRRQANIKKLKDKIQTTKEDLTELCEEMVSKMRTVRWMGMAAGASEPRKGRAPYSGEGPPLDDQGISQAEQIQTELKNLRAQCRRQCEVLLSMIHDLALEQEHCERLEDAASHEAPKEPRHSPLHPRMTKGSPMVFPRKNSRVV